MLSQQHRDGRVVTGHIIDATASRGPDRKKPVSDMSAFTSVVGQAAGIERTLGIYNLAQFTPRG